MKIHLEPGKYIVAVSGGVDSVDLLDVLSKQQDLELVVAHFDHGIRGDSAEDRKFVEDLAKKYGLLFEYEEGNLGEDISEARAREARYKFLKDVKEKHRAQAIVTAHHQDDLLETIILNLLRGTGRKGITSLSDHKDIKRPLLKTTKQQILDYAQQHELTWHEDPSNVDTNYLRNKIRHQIIPKLSDEDREKFLSIHESLAKQNPEIDNLLATYQKEENKLSKKDVNMADHKVARELISSRLRANGVADLDQKKIERIVVGAKTLKHGKEIPVNKGATIEVQKDLLLLKP